MGKGISKSGYLIMLAEVEYNINYYKQQKYFPGCWPGIEYADNGNFIIEQNIEFHLECQPGFTRPFGSKRVWFCNSSNLSPASPIPKNEDNAYIPTTYVEQILPQSVHLDLEATTVTPKVQECTSDPNDGATLEDVVIGGFLFQLYTSPYSRECKVTVNTDGILTGVLTSYTFRIHHRPVTNYLQPGVLDSARLHLRLHARRVMTRLYSQNSLNFTLGPDNNFRAGACVMGSLVEASEDNFETNISFCRMCAIGMFMNLDLKLCLPCEIGYNDFPGAVSCKPCPVVMAEADKTAQSITGCYVDIDNQPDRTVTLREGILFFFIFHLVVFCLVIWNIKYFQPLIS
ncbi:hypothetical protein Btru_034526 [Bulinus truncatus]|nr:hypothetical protein Btru_034526 [Bulinus truncatus]